MQLQKMFITYILLFVIIFFSTEVLGQKNTRYMNDNVKNKNFAYLKSYNDKYSFEVKLFSNQLFVSRLKKVIGQRHSLIKKYWNVATPIEIRNNYMIASGCQAHNCGYTNFMIVYSFAYDKFYIGIREDEKVDLYSEDKSDFPERLLKWAKKNE